MIANDLLVRHSTAWRDAIVHPFLTGVRDGTLPAESFDRWLAQDYLFVQVLVRAQSRFAAGAPLADIGLLASGVTATSDELTWFREMAARRDVGLDVALHPANRAYCDFLLALTYAGYPAQVTAVWALERAYLEGWDGARPGAEPFREFVARWTTRGFRTYIDGLEAAVDRQLAEATVDQREEAEEAFLWVARHERDFWEMATTG